MKASGHHANHTVLNGRSAQLDLCRIRCRRTAIRRYVHADRDGELYAGFSNRLRLSEPQAGSAQRRRPTSLARRRARPPSWISGEARRRTPAVKLVAACGRPESRLTDATQHSAPVTDTVDDFCSSLSIGRTTFCKLVREKRIRLETSNIPTNNGA